jgi:type IV pilus assembly protein PilP
MIGRMRQVSDMTHHTSASSARRTFVAVAIVGGLLLAGCSSRDADLDKFIEQTRLAPGGRVEPLPEVKPYDSYSYSSSALRSPFVPGSSANANNSRTNDHRNHEFLEQFSLDTLRMVGTLNQAGQFYGLVQARDGRVQRVVVGNHMGQNEGRITAITPTKITLTEVVPDGLGGYLERPAALALNE